MDGKRETAAMTGGGCGGGEREKRKTEPGVGIKGAEFLVFCVPVQNPPHTPSQTQYSRRPCPADSEYLRPATETRLAPLYAHEHS